MSARLNDFGVSDLAPALAGVSWIVIGGTSLAPVLDVCFVVENRTALSEAGDSLEAG